MVANVQQIVFGWSQSSFGDLSEIDLSFAVFGTPVPTTMKGALFMLVLLLISVSGQVLMLGQAQEWAYEAGRAITAGL